MYLGSIPLDNPGVVAGIVILSLVFLIVYVLGHWLESSNKRDESSKRAKRKFSDVFVINLRGWDKTSNGQQSQNEDDIGVRNTRNETNQENFA